MELSLNRQDLLQVSATCRKTMRLLPMGKKKAQLMRVLGSLAPGAARGDRLLQELTALQGLCDQRIDLPSLIAAHWRQNGFERAVPEHPRKHGSGRQPKIACSVPYAALFVARHII